MRKSLSITALVCLIISGCSKDNGNLGFVRINGTQYPTVVIGSQTWTSVNYNGPGGANYNNSPTNNPVYGKLYSYTEAEAIAVPSGWRLPTQADFITLLKTLGAKPSDQNYYVLVDSTGRGLMSKTTWTEGEIGTNKTGFNAVGAGFQSSGVFTNLGEMTNILSTSKFQNGSNISLQIYDYYYGNAAIVDLNAVIPYDSDRGSVRFVKDN